VEASRKLRAKYGADFHFVFVHIIEPHPGHGDPSPYHQLRPPSDDGSWAEWDYMPAIPQPRTLADREEASVRFDSMRGLLDAAVATGEAAAAEGRAAAEKFDPLLSMIPPSGERPSPGAFDMVVLDTLETEGMSTSELDNNHMWCNWATAPNPGWIVRSDGVVELALIQHDEKSLDAAMASLIPTRA